MWNWDEGRRTDQPKGGVYARYVRKDELRVEARAYVEVVTPIVAMSSLRMELGRTSSKEQTKSRKNTGEAHVEINCSQFTVAQKGRRDGTKKLNNKKR